MGVLDNAGFIRVEIEHQIRLKAPFLCSFLKEGLWNRMLVALILSLSVIFLIKRSLINILFF
jgi:hypothetical protein